MTDHFAVLGVPRSPWLEADALKDRFHRLSAQHHPDVPGGSAPAFAELNAAWQMLRGPAKCLRHYLELEHPASLETAGETPGELVDLFMGIAAFRQATQRVVNRLAAATAPLVRALLEADRIALRKRLEDFAVLVARRTDEHLAALRSGELTAENLAKRLSSLVFLEKWSEHLEEARLAL